MTSVAKLKDRARKYEQKEDWQAAIDAYREVLEAGQGEGETELELALFNRVGDLYLRLGQIDNAVSYYETAADKYAEAGFYNNAIALCNKALRHRPDRAEIFLKLSRLCGEQGFLTDARRWIVDYAERRVKTGQVDEAMRALEEFADNSDDADIRELLAQQLIAHKRPQDAVAQLAKAHAKRLASGDSQAAAALAERARTIDPSVDLSTAAAPAGPEWEAPAEEAAGEPASMTGLEATAAGAGAADAEEAPMAGLEVSYTERGPAAKPEEADAASLGGLETFGTLDLEGAAGAEPGAGVEPVPGAGLEPEATDDQPEPLPLVDTGFQDEGEEPEPLPMLDSEQSSEGADLPFLDFGTPAAAGAEKGAGGAEPEGGMDLDLGAAVTGEPAETAGGGMDMGGLDLGFGAPTAPAAPAEGLDTAATIDRAKELVSRGLGGEALRELQLLSSTAAPPETFRQAIAVVNEVLRHEPGNLTALQRRVEYAARVGERATLVQAYLELAAELARSGAEIKAEAMYQRVLKLAPDNAVARDALYGTEEAEEEAETIDLDAILREVEPAQAGAGGQSGGDTGFAAMLSQFKAKVSEPTESEDAGDHYDLGLAFKEMGLIDEAIAEFQTALTGGEERLKVYEELGQCYMMKEQYNVALKILTRAIQVPYQDESELLGVYYHLGKCYEELGNRAEAKEAYAKVLDIDPDFQDVPARVARL